MTEIKVGDWVYVTTKWVSQGILKQQVSKLWNYGVCTLEMGALYSGKEYFLTESEAIADFEKRKAARIASLKKSLARVEKMEPKIKEVRL